jgi:hypothetical protein
MGPGSVEPTEDVAFQTIGQHDRKGLEGTYMAADALNDCARGFLPEVRLL